MSQSPITAGPLEREDDYYQNWNALGELIKRGNSFSGRERNCVFLNTGKQQFADVSGVTRLDYKDDGRCVGLIDWDLDGDLDLWLVNRTAPRVRLLRNDWADANRHLSIRLVGSRSNRDAIGARVELQLDGGRRLVDTVRAGDGFLTQSTKWLHFGVGQHPRVVKLRIRWPGTLEWEELEDLATNQRYEIVQGASNARIVKTEPINWSVSPEPRPTPQSSSRVALTARVPLPETAYRDFRGEPKSLRDHRSGPLLVSFWATWCPPCIQELRDLSASASAFQEAALTSLTLCVDGLQSESVDLTKAEGLLQQLSVESPTGVATPELVSGFTRLLSWIFYRQRPLPLPCSFLLDSDGRLAFIYRGSVAAEQVLADVRLLNEDAETLLASEFPGTGRFLFSRPGINPILLVRAHREGGYYEDARRMLLDSLAEAKQRGAPSNLLISLLRELSLVEAELGNSSGVVDACREAVKLNPNDPALAIALGVALANQGDHKAASEYLLQLSESSPDDTEVQRMLGQAWLSMRDAPRASSCFARVVQQVPDDIQARFQLATSLQMQRNLRESVQHYKEVLVREPSHVMAANNLAWIFSTSGDASERDGKRAIQLAETACRLTEHRAPAFVGTLSAAYAEAGQFELAVKTAEQALRLARERGQHQLVAGLQERLRLHRQGLPYRDSPEQK